jgi:hypothetical protein
MPGSEGIPWLWLFVLWYGLTAVIYGFRYFYKRSVKSLEDGAEWVNVRNKLRLLQGGQSEPMAVRAQKPLEPIQAPNVVQGEVLDLKDARLAEKRVQPEDLTWQDVFGEEKNVKPSWDDIKPDWMN